jgi:hypothetical protein
MRRTLVLVAAATSVILGVAGPAAAGGPPSSSGDKDCRIGTMCNTSIHWGWDGDVPERRNLGG